MTSARVDLCLLALVTSTAGYAPVFRPLVSAPRCAAPSASTAYARRAGDTAAVEVETVNNLLAERGEARSERDYARADAIKKLLVSEHGVQVIDRSGEWYVGEAQPARDFTPRNFGPLGHDYKQTEEDATPLAEEKLKEVNDLLRDRLAAKLVHDFDAADLRLQALAALGVEVNDGRKEWRADGEPFKPRGFLRVNGSGGAAEDEVDVVLVEELLARRLEAKRERDYETADAIKAQLQIEHHVAVNDGRRTWSVGTNRAGGYVLEGDPPAGLDVAHVEELLARRAKAKITRDYAAADELQAEICGFGLELNDRDRMWRAAS